MLRYFGLDLMGKDWRHEFATYEARMSMADDIVRMYYTMNERVYDERIWHRMRLDQPQIWTIKHVAGQHVDSEKSHNWHIHAYHFQIDHAVRDTSSPPLRRADADRRARGRR